MEEKVKSGKEILNDFFNGIGEINGVDENISSMLKKLYEDGNLTDINVKNALQTLREQDESQN